MTRRPNLWQRWRNQRHARRDMAVLGCLARGDIYVYDIWRRIGGSSGGIYLALRRLEIKGLVWSAWVEQPGGPKRCRYGITHKAVTR